MPLPEPRKGETEDEFIARCMGDDTTRDEYPDQDQRRAVCQSRWDRRGQRGAVHPVGLDSLGVPHLDQYFGVWAIVESVFRTAVDRVSALDLRAHVETHRATADRPDYRHETASEGIALVRLTGPLMKYPSSLSDGTSTLIARRQLRNAVESDEIAGILLQIDSPGGTLAGTPDLADDVAAAAKRKPVHAYIEDMGGSAAYWVASQASKVYANRTAMVGSIGVYSVIHDFSGYAAREGIKVHVLRTSPFKGAGEKGTEVTAEQLADWQRVVDDIGTHFLDALASGRRMGKDKVDQVADGRIHVGVAAEAIGLIDGIRSYEDAVRELMAQTQQNRRIKAMTDQTGTPQPATADRPEQVELKVAALESTIATYHELVEACPGADSEFLCAQLAAKATVEQARTNWMAAQNDTLKGLQTQLDQTKAEAAKPGVEALGGGEGGPSAESGGDPIGRWQEALAAKRAQGLDVTAATRAVVKADPELHAAYLEAWNAQHKGRPTHFN